MSNLVAHPVPRTHRLSAVLASLLLAVALLITVGASPARADQDIPTGGLDWKVMKKRLPAPHKDCVARLQVAKTKKHVWFQRSISCKEAKQWMQMERFAQRNGKALKGFNGQGDNCSPNDGYSYTRCHRTTKFKNPKGKQKWSFFVRTNVNYRGEGVDLGWLSLSA